MVLLCTRLCFLQFPDTQHTARLCRRLDGGSAGAGCGTTAATKREWRGHHSGAEVAVCRGWVGLGWAVHVLDTRVTLFETSVQARMIGTLWVGSVEEVWKVDTGNV